MRDRLTGRWPGPAGAGSRRTAAGRGQAADEQRGTQGRQRDSSHGALDARSGPIGSAADAGAHAATQWSRRCGASRGVPLRAALLATAGCARVLPRRRSAHGETHAGAGSARRAAGVAPRSVLPLAGVAVATVAYLWAVRQVARRHPANPPPRLADRRRSWAAWRRSCVALCSPIEAYEGQLFSVHMVQHMLLELVAAPLLLLGAPVTLALRAASPSVRATWLLAVLHSRAVAVLTFPLLTWLALRRRQLGLALQHALRPGPGERRRCTTSSTRPSWSRRCSSGGRWSAPIRPDGASPTRSASSISSWPCRRTRSWAWR